MTPRILSLASGYGGLDTAVQSVLGGTVIAVSDVEPGPSAILAHHYPGVPNLGDIRTITAADVPGHVDILTAGYPCQPFSVAGRQRGTDDPRHIWPDIARIIGDVRPRLVVLENVPGHLRIGFGDVLGGLAALGYDAQWTCVRASDVGACHQRRRLFVAAYPAGQHCDEWRQPAPGQAESGRALGELAGRGRASVALLPTPLVSDAKMASPGDGRRKSPGLRSLPRLLPTPRATDGTHGGPNQRGSKGDLMLPAAVQPEVWGQYADAVQRHSDTYGPPPAPTEPTGRNGAHRLAPRFVEWMMCLPPGHVTDVPGLTRAQQLRAIGNGVVPPQAIYAYEYLLGVAA